MVAGRHADDAAGTRCRVELREGVGGAAQLEAAGRLAAFELQVDRGAGRARPAGGGLQRSVQYVAARRGGGRAELPGVGGEQFLAQPDAGGEAAAAVGTGNAATAQ